MKLINIISEELLKFLKENYDSEQGSILDTYFDKKHFGGGETKKGLSGEFIGTINYQPKSISTNIGQQRPYNVYKNPKTLDGFDPNCRGVLLEDGDVYVVDNSNISHGEILFFLENNKIIPKGHKFNYYRELPEEFICVHRWGNTNNFALSTAYEEYEVEIPPHYIYVMESASKKGNIKYVNTPHMDESLNEIIDEELQDITNIMSYRPDNDFDSGILYEEEDIDYDLYELEDTIKYNLLNEFINENNPTYTKPCKWFYLNENVIKSIWEYYIKFKDVRNLKGLATIEKTMTINILKISNFQYLGGGTSSNPDEDFDGAWDDYLDRYFETGDSRCENLNNFLNENIDEDLDQETNKENLKNKLKEKFWWYFSAGHSSDYGIQPLLKLLSQLRKETSPEQKLITIDKMLNVVHQTSDLAANFLRGGSAALSNISGYDVGTDEYGYNTQSVISGKYKMNDY